MNVAKQKRQFAFSALFLIRKIIIHCPLFIIHWHKLHLCPIGYIKKPLGVRYVCQIYGSALQIGHLHLRRAAAGVYRGCDHPPAGGAGECHRGAGAVPVGRLQPTQGRLCDPLGEHLPHRAGYRAGGYQARRLPGSAQQGKTAILISICHPDQA